MKFSMKRIAAFVLALVMVIGLVPVVNNTVNAAVNADFTGLTDESIGVSLTNSSTAATSTWSGSENTITGSLTGQKKTAKLYLTAKDTLTITNNKSSKAKLSFDYTTSGNFTTGTITIGSEPAITSATSGTYSVDLEAGASTTIVLSVAQSKTGTNQIGISMTNVTLAIVGGSAVDATFEAPAYGSYTVAYGDESVTVAAGTASQVITNMPSVSYTLTANPGEGYKFVGWYNVTTGTYLSTNATYSCSIEEAATLKAVIVPADSAVFLTGGNYYTDLNEAVTYAAANSLTQITLVQSGTLVANDTGYTIPAGITLLIPMDDLYTVTPTNNMGIAPEFTLDVVTPYAYKTLTLAEGAALIVNGTVDIESKHTTLQGAANKRVHGGRPSGAYGAIYMSPNSNITLNDGANLYAWGYVYGDGAITANSGAKVYEYMQVTDFPGGGNLSLFVDAALDADGEDDDGIFDNDYIKTFPFSQYYVQNIEVALTLMAGATESVFTTVTVQAMSMGMPVEFMGNNGMFVPGTGSITKDYDPSTDRLIVNVNGDATVRGIVMDMSESDFAGAMEDIIGTAKFDSSRYILTLNSNITINVNSGTTTVGQDMALLPGVEIYVGKDATMRIAEKTLADGEVNCLTMYGSGGYNVYVYDLDQFGKFVFQNQYLIPASYSPTTGRYVRAYKDLKDAVIDIDGKLICDGFLYSTVTTDPDTFEAISGGATIISSGKSGSIVFQNGCGVEEFAFCLDGNSNTDNYVEVESAWLLNGDGSYVKTICDGCADYFDDIEDCDHVGLTYNYCAIHDLWYTEGHGLCGSDVEITWIINGVDETSEVPHNTVPVYPGNPTKPTSGCTVYTFAGWSTSANGAVLSELPAATASATYFAIFTESTSHVGDNDQDHYCDGCDDGPSNCVDENADHICDFTGCKAVMSDCVDGNQDHYCDAAGCKAEMSQCKDSNKDHYCDYLGCLDKMSNCADDNDDHICDYTGCNDEMSQCKDDNEDHVCDYLGCQVGLSDCVDGNQDHYCDYTGCNSVMSSCRDSNMDHYCDYLGCLAQIDGCIDNDQNHICDYTGCEEKLSDCADDDQDHICDYTGCKAELSTCVDNDNNHNCDYYGCNAELSNCIDGDQNHKCDYTGCGVWMSECVDDDADHYCDYTGCVDKMSECVDEDQDHDCDYVGCGEKMSECVDEDQDHYCDYVGCGDKMSECVDEDQDHNCDYAGCQAELSSCVDDDDNHYCDYNGCAAELSTCVDDDKNHYCDYAGCGVWMSECVDANEDHYCDFDGCKLETSTCVDNDMDHYCDYSGCNDELSTCVDDDADHYCDYSDCNDELSTCVDTDEDHYCDYAGCGSWMSDCVDDDEDHYCDYSGCGAELTNCSDDPNDGDHNCDYAGCGKAVADSVCYGGEATCTEGPICEDCGQAYSEALGHGHTEGFGYNPNYDGTHVKWCLDCTETIDEAEECTFGDDNLCIYCEATEQVTVIFMNGDTEFDSATVDYGTKLNLYGFSGPVPADGQHLGGFFTADGKNILDIVLTEDITVYAKWHTMTYVAATSATCAATGNIAHYYCEDCSRYFEAEKTDGYYFATTEAAVTVAIDENAHDYSESTGWYTVGGDYYYGTVEVCSRDESHVIYNPVTGIVRVPYNTELGYGPDQDALDYCTNNGTTFIDATEAWFIFGEDGKFQATANGLTADNRWAVNGMIAWHPGLVEIDGDYYYFTGDEVNGGNKMATGDVYVVRNNTTLSVTIGGIYTFDNDGKLCDYDGITEVNGVLRYYEDAQLMIGNGLTQVGENYIYVDYAGNLVVDAEYYVGSNGFGINTGIYSFDENGFMVIPEENGWNGFYKVDGVWYYYVNGEKAYCAGLISTTGIMWHETADAEGVENQGWVYVKSNGALAIGEYYVTNVGDGASIGIASGDLCMFGNDGLLQENRNGIVDGYYYVDNKIAYAAGLIEIDGDYYYVRSNGQIVTGRRYWVTNVNATGIEAAEYDFDENGKLIFPVEDTFTGIRDGKYYVDGHTAYGAGLIQIDGKWYYVRSNGQLATGKYWITNTNGEMAEGYYNFGEDGVLVTE